MAVTLLTSGAKTLTLTKNSKKLEAAEMRLLKSVTGVTPLVQKRSEDIRKYLKIFKLTDRLDLTIKQWKQHLETMSDNRIPKNIYRCKPESRRDVGRPRSRRKEQD
jgi:hypothetical protein